MICDRLESSTINRRAVSSSKHARHYSRGTSKGRARMVSGIAKLIQSAAKYYIIDAVGQCHSDGYTAFDIC